MKRRPRSEREQDDVAMRIGGLAAGLLAGLAIGVAAGILLFTAGSEFAAGVAFFICITTGAVAGYLSSAAGLGLAEGVVHFAIGAAHGIAKRIPSPSKLAPRWLRWFLFSGLLFGLFVLLMRRW